jgi:hypothetical protein
MQNAQLGLRSTMLLLRIHQMKKFLTLFAARFLSATVSTAGPKPEPGSILSHTSVACGSKKSKKQDIDLLCQQYVVRSGATDYTIRQPKPSEQTIISVKHSDPVHSR